MTLACPHRVLSFVLIITAVVAPARAGDLDPPAGPIGPTMKPLDQVEPRIAINAQNTPGDGLSRFRITQSGSYYLTGNVTGQLNRHGIVIAASNVTVDLMGFALQGSIASLDGISVHGARSNITIRNGTVTGWGQDGVDLRHGASSSDEIGIGAHLDGLHSSSNGSHGFVLCRGAVVTNCTASLNSGNGFISTNAGTNVLRSCTALDNGGTGISTDNGSIVSHCTAENNGGHGISVSVGSTVINCQSRRNNVDGIRNSGSCSIRGNNCDLNGFVGINVTGTRSRIEENHCTLNGVGVSTAGSANLIIHNSAGGNTTNYSIGSGNHFGTILNNPGQITSGNPWANIGY